MWSDINNTQVLRFALGRDDMFLMFILYPLINQYNFGCNHICLNSAPWHLGKKNRVSACFSVTSCVIKSLWPTAVTLKIHPLRLSILGDWHGLGMEGEGANAKESACQCRRHKRHKFKPWVRKILWSKAQKYAPVYLPGETHGQRSLEGYST